MKYLIEVLADHPSEGLTLRTPAMQKLVFVLNEDGSTMTPVHLNLPGMEEVSRLSLLKVTPCKAILNISEPLHDVDDMFPPGWSPGTLKGFLAMVAVGAVVAFVGGPIVAGAVMLLDWIYRCFA